MAITIYRVTNHGDGIGGSDQIIFNNSSAPNPKSTKLPNAYITSYEITNTGALAENQTPSQDTAGLQHLGEIEDLYIFTILFTKRDAVPHTYQDIFDTWVSEPKVNAAFVNGRFGVAFDDRPKKNVVPLGTTSSQIGLMWVDSDEKNDFGRVPLAGNVVLRLKISRSDGT